MKVSRFGSRGRLCFPQGLAGEGDILPVLFGRPDTLFLNGSLRWRRKRKIADWLTFIFSFAKRALGSASVLSGCSATSFLDQISVRCKRKCLVAAKFGRADTACFALTPDEPANGA
jgi:hypothetical protein